MDSNTEYVKRTYTIEVSYIAKDTVPMTADRLCIICGHLEGLIAKALPNADSVRVIHMEQKPTAYPPEPLI